MTTGGDHSTKIWIPRLAKEGEGETLFESVFYGLYNYGLETWDYIRWTYIGF